jgi:N6-adenosine-specific RNA methylase IME4
MFDVIVADCPWIFQDRLEMSDVKRGAEANYSVLTMEEIKKLQVKDIAATNSVLALWVPSSLLQDGLDVMKAWGFTCKQTHVWVKTKKDSLANFNARARKYLVDKNQAIENIEFKLDECLAFGMGRLFRQTHEIVLVGTRGKVSSLVKNKSQRSVHFGPVNKHSEKPEDLQDMLDLMFPQCKKLEMFARRERMGWSCIGNESPTSLGEDIRTSIERLKNENATT